MNEDLQERLKLFTRFGHQSLFGNRWGYGCACVQSWNKANEYTRKDAIDCAYHGVAFYWSDDPPPELKDLPRLTQEFLKIGDKYFVMILNHHA